MFSSLNRWLGFPGRVYVESEFSLKTLVDSYNGKRPCFVSVARFANKSEAYMSYFPFDFDSQLNLRIPYKESKCLMDFFNKHDIPHRIVGSGGKGFHVYFEFEEVEVTDAVYSKIYSIQYSLKKYFNLQSTDEPLFGKRALMIRIPTTKYVCIKKKRQDKNFYQTGNYCRYIEDDDFDKGLPHVEKLLLAPGELPKKSKDVITLDDIIDKIPDFKLKQKTDGILDIDLVAGGMLTPTNSSVGLPCLLKIAQSQHPSHSDRIELVAWLKMQGYRDMAVVDYIRKLKWTDFNLSQTTKNVQSVNARFPCCSILRERYPNICEACSFRKTLNKVT